MVRFILFVAIFVSLSACNFNITPTFYIRDIQDVISDKKDIEIPIFIKLPASDVDSCNSEIGQVIGILDTYSGNTLSVISGSNNSTSGCSATVNAAREQLVELLATLEAERLQKE